MKTLARVPVPPRSVGVAKPDKAVPGKGESEEKIGHGESGLKEIHEEYEKKKE